MKTVFNFNLFFASSLVQSYNLSNQVAAVAEKIFFLFTAALAAV
jgi:hypothetical protein